VYSVAAYVEADRCAKELGVRSRGGFFGQDATDDFCSALMDGAFNKALTVSSSNCWYSTPSFAHLQVMLQAGDTWLKVASRAVHTLVAS
jgi:hypothetical protein